MPVRASRPSKGHQKAKPTLWLIGIFTLGLLLSLGGAALADHKPNHTPGGGSGKPPPPEPQVGEPVLAMWAASRIQGTWVPEILLSDDQGVVTSTMTDGRWPSWSPEGNRLAFSSERIGPTGIYVIDVDPDSSEVSSPRQLISTPSEIVFPAWNPLREEIVYALAEAGSLRRDLFLLNVDDPDEVIKVTNQVEPFRYGEGAWAPDGNRLVVNKDADLVVLTLGLNGEAAGEVSLFVGTGSIFDSGARAIGVDWARTRDFVIFNARAPADPDNRYKLWCIDLAARDQPVLIWDWDLDLQGSANRVGVEDLSFGPNDQQLAVLTFDNGLWLLDLAPQGSNACPLGTSGRTQLIERRDLGRARHLDWKRAPAP